MLKTLDNTLTDVFYTNLKNAPPENLNSLIKLRNNFTYEDIITSNIDTMIDYFKSSYHVRICN
ncbi:hypothetical protein C8D73_1087 [Phascolarctobacterium faecium DSM 14760]|jgi:hypothetical protein|nr:hypothetical protein C8D73_1087 [Phascolarctobacterium faecium DSM 14760]BBG62990.1 hypothetical protein PFJ30894_00613 [Phascolarctobacterium faecium]